MIFHSHANKTHFHETGCALGIILKERVFGTRKLAYRPLACSARAQDITVCVEFTGEKCLIGRRATTCHCQIQEGGNTSIDCLFQWKED